MGSATDRIQSEELKSKLSLFENYPPIIRRVIIDKPDGWEYRLTAELMRYFNRPLFRKIEDLRDGLYVKSQIYIDSDEVLDWVHKLLIEGSKLVTPIEGLLDRLTKSWGPPRGSGNAEEIHHITCLIRDYLEHIIQYEEQIYFTNVPEEYDKLVNLLKNLMGSQAEKIKEIPDCLDEAVSLIGTDHGGTTENPLVIKKTITFELPKNWEKKINRELKRARGYQSKESDNTKTSGCTVFLVGICILLLIIGYSC